MGNLALIPARSGSKGLINKNIKLLQGKPLIAYSIEAARESGVFDEIYVSTDSQEYAEIALQYGAKVPFLRNPDTSTDTATSWDVVKEALDRYEKQGIKFDMVTLLQPTTPLRTADDICSAYELFLKEQAKAVVSVCEMDHSPLWCSVLPQDHSLVNFIPKEVMETPRQELPTYYRINGGIYMVRTDYILRTTNLYEAGCYAYVMEKKNSVDIDDEFDFKMAEAILEMRT
ncbi:MAG: acylneuraminate cytidylyltransferase family protein [Mobilitalea sp.]